MSKPCPPILEVLLAILDLNVCEPWLRWPFLVVWELFWGEHQSFLELESKRPRCFFKQLIWFVRQISTGMLPFTFRMDSFWSTNLLGSTNHSWGVKVSFPLTRTATNYLDFGWIVQPIWKVILIALYSPCLILATPLTVLPFMINSWVSYLGIMTHTGVYKVFLIVTYNDVIIYGHKQFWDIYSDCAFPQWTVIWPFLTLSGWGLSI